MCKYEMDTMNIVEDTEQTRLKNKTFKNFVINLTRDTPSNDSDHLC